MEEKDVIQTLKNSIAQLDTETLQATLAYLLKVYVIDKDLAYEGVSTEAATPVFQTALNIEPPANFFELIGELKRQYRLPELKLFTLEGGKVYITLNNTRYQITADRAAGAGQTGLQALEDSGAGRRPAAPASDNRPEASSNAADGNAGASANKAAPKAPFDRQQPDGTITPHRFKNLEMD